MSLITVFQVYPIGKYELLRIKKKIGVKITTIPQMKPRLYLIQKS